MKYSTYYFQRPKKILTQRANSTRTGNACQPTHTPTHYTVHFFTDSYVGKFLIPFPISKQLKCVVVTPQIQCSLSTHIQNYTETHKWKANKKMGCTAYSYMLSLCVIICNTFVEVFVRKEANYIAEYMKALVWVWKKLKKIQFAIYEYV